MVTFYAWTDHRPSHETVCISSPRRRDRKGLSKSDQTPHVELKFKDGKAETSDELVISQMRELIKGGANYTEDADLFEHRTRVKP